MRCSTASLEPPPTGWSTARTRTPATDIVPSSATTTDTERWRVGWSTETEPDGGSWSVVGGATGGGRRWWAGRPGAVVAVVDDVVSTGASLRASLALLRRAGAEPVVVVLSGADRVDPEKLGRHMGTARVARADPDAVRAATGFPIGGVSPVAHGARVVVDRGLAAHEAIWAAAGTPRAVFRTSFSELLAAVPGASVADVRAGSRGAAPGG